MFFAASVRPRRLNILAGAARLLGLAAILLYATSWSHPITIFFTRDLQQYRAWINAGGVGVDNQPQVAIETAQRERDLDVMRVIAGRDLMMAPPSHVVAKWSRTSALLLPAIAIAFNAVVVFPRILRRALGAANESAHRCISCGYNLTGNTSGTCPECGSHHASARTREVEQA